MSCNLKKFIVNLIVCAAAANLVGCASLKDNPDPYEPFNRKVFAFNQLADDIVMKPIAMSYRGLFPKFMRQGLDNFFTNATDTSIVINDILQFKLVKAGQDTTRIAINTTVGLAGFLDVASSWGWQRQPLTFGDTLSVYGWKNSAYVVLPFFGPSTVRDTVGSVPDWYFTPWPYIEPEEVRIGLFSLYLINLRANYLDLEGLIKVATFDDYVLMRDVFFQRRDARLTGNNNETSEDEDELYPE